jgi:hypothetical protein
MKKTLFRIVIILITCVSFSLNDHVRCQTTYNLTNGQVILQMNGELFNTTSPDSIPIINGVIMVKYSPDTDSATIENIETEYSIIMKNQLLANWRSYYVPDQDSTVQLVQSLLSIPDIVDINFNYALDFFMAPLDAPNDPHYTNDQWYIPEIHVDDAWEVTTGDPKLVVGVLDCGVDYTNPDLDVEDDQSVYPDDDCFHGTWMTSLIAAKTNNEIGTAGIAGGWNSHPVTVKNYKLEGVSTAFLESAASALNDAVGDGIRLFNFSWGQDMEGSTCLYWSQFYSSLTDAIIDAHDHFNAIMFASVGNVNDVSIAYPACMEDYILAVGATDHDQYRWEYTNSSGSSYGENTFISTPGVDIIYPLVGSPYEYETWGGATSPSCAIATGVAALLLSINPCLSNADLREILKNSADQVGGYDYDWNVEKPGHSQELGYGKIDAYEAILLASDPILEITQNTTFNQPKWFTHNLIVHSGSTLTITSTIKFTTGTKIIVERGGHLIVDGGVLSTDCPDFWGGIELESDPDLPQVPTSNQGFLTLQNGAVIEKAYFGVKNYIPDPDDQGLPFPSSYGGGIVWAEETTFINCAVAASFGQYPDYPSSSKFHNCTFITDNYFFHNQNPSCFVNMGNVSNIKFYKCTFDNQGPEFFRGRGIQAMNSTFYIDALCSVQQSPCPKEYIEPSVFHNLDYGIYALNTGTTDFFKVNHSEFLGNMHGIYASAVNFATVTSNTFSVIGIDEAYGLYFENSTGYHVEDNHFTGDAVGSSEEVGVYIRNSGYDQNWVYNNWFTDLYCGAVGDGINRRYIGKTGLCFKCNVFTDNVTDLFITKDQGAPISADHSIAFYQGYDLLGDTMPAGNEFSEDGWSIKNEVSPIVYNYHHYYNPTIKIYPDPVTTQTVGRHQVDYTSYLKETSCPSWINKEQPDPEDLLVGLESVYLNITETLTEIEALLDNGNTEDLNTEVLLASPDSSAAVYNSLLMASPLLSDTVMISTVENEAAIPNAMLRDILVANPQSAKSSEIMQKVDERFIPMIPEMKNEVLEGINIISERDEHEMGLAVLQDQWGFAYQELQRHYLSDTSGSSLDDIKSLLTGIYTPDARYSISAVLMNEGRFTEAETILDSVPLLFELNTQQMELYTDFEVVEEFFQTIIANGNQVLECDSVAAASLQSLLEHDAFTPGAISRNILIARANLNYLEPVNLPDEQAASSPVFNHQGTKDDNDSRLNLSPNPASGYVIASYDATSAGSLFVLKIIDILGKELISIPLSSNNNQRVILLSYLNPGTYFVQLQNGGKTIKSATLIKL